jgi:hypothetical protein
VTPYSSHFQRSVRAAEVFAPSLEGVGCSFLYHYAWCSLTRHGTREWYFHVSREYKRLCALPTAGKLCRVSTRSAEVTEVKQRKGNKRGHKRKVGEAFAGRRDTRPQEPEDGVAPFGMGHQFCDNHT